MQTWSLNNTDWERFSGKMAIEIRSVIHYNIFMARGRNTTVLQTRVPDSLADAAKAYAEKKGITVSEILKELLAKTLRKEESK